MHSDQTSPRLPLPNQVFTLQQLNSIDDYKEVYGKKFEDGNDEYESIFLNTLLGVPETPGFMNGNLTPIKSDSNYLTTFSQIQTPNAKRMNDKIPTSNMSHNPPSSNRLEHSNSRNQSMLDISRDRIS